MDVVEREQLTPNQALDHWYYQSKLQLLLNALRSRDSLKAGMKITDVGCGVGLFLTLLEKSGNAKAEQLLGIDPAYSEAATAFGGNAVLLPKWPEAESVDLALLMDVLEHTPDDIATLKESVQHLKDGGLVFITVPALSWLYSAHDRFLGHYRRYSVKSLGAVIAACGNLEICDLHYYFASILPVAMPWRFARRSSKVHEDSDLKQLPFALNWLLRRIMLLELHFARMNKVAGLSVVALCKKRGDTIN